MMMSKDTRIYFNARKLSYYLIGVKLSEPGVGNNRSGRKA